MNAQHIRTFTKKKSSLALACFQGKQLNFSFCLDVMVKSINGLEMKKKNATEKGHTQTRKRSNPIAPYATTLRVYSIFIYSSLFTRFLFVNIEREFTHTTIPYEILHTDATLVAKVSGSVRS